MNYSLSSELMYKGVDDKTAKTVERFLSKCVDMNPREEITKKTTEDAFSVQKGKLKIRCREGVNVILYNDKNFSFFWTISEGKDNFLISMIEEDGLHVYGYDQKMGELGVTKVEGGYPSERYYDNEALSYIDFDEEKIGSVEERLIEKAILPDKRTPIYDGVNAKILNDVVDRYISMANENIKTL